MTPELAAFLERADKLPRTLRYKALDKLESYYEGTQYCDRRLDASGYHKSSPGVYGSMVRTPPWSERDPGAVWNLVRESVHELTDWAVAGDSFCHLEIADDDAAEDWLGAVALQANLGDVIAQARNWAGAVGTACVSFAVRDGEFFLEAHNPKITWPLSWRDPQRHRPAAVAQVYLGDDMLAERDSDRPMVCRYWDEQVEAIYRREKRKGSDEWVWIEVESVAHGLGFCPVYWYPQNPTGGSHEGHPDGGDTFDEVDEVSELVAAAGATTKRNADDTLVIKEDPALNPGKVNKGGFNVIFARGGAEYLSQDGASAKICVELAEKHKEHVYRRFGVVKVGLEELGKATSGEALKRLFQPTMKTAGGIRRSAARGLIVPLCQGLLEAGRRLTGRGLAIVVPPRVTERDEIKTVEARVPGKSSAVTCIWPDAFQPTMADLKTLIDGAVAAVGGPGKQVMSLQSAVAWLKGSPLPISSVEEELERIEEDQEEAAERGAKALGLGQEPHGEAGPVGGKGEGEGEGEEPEEEAEDEEKEAAE